jgi:hypothetical protein
MRKLHWKGNARDEKAVLRVPKFGWCFTFLGRFRLPPTFLPQRQSVFPSTFLPLRQSVFPSTFLPLRQSVFPSTFLPLRQSIGIPIAVTRVAVTRHGFRTSDQPDSAGFPLQGPSLVPPRWSAGDWAKKGVRRAVWCAIRKERYGRPIRATQQSHSPNPFALTGCHLQWASIVTCADQGCLVPLVSVIDLRGYLSFIGLTGYGGMMTPDDVIVTFP